VFEGMNVKPGSEISCPFCDKVMVRCLKVPERGQQDWADCFEAVDWKGQAGDHAACDCGGIFYLAGAGVYVKGVGYTW
jgi:hypothetical protein